MLARAGERASPFKGALTGETTLDEATGAWASTPQTQPSAAASADFTDNEVAPAMTKRYTRFRFGTAPEGSEDEIGHIITQSIENLASPSLIKPATSDDEP